MRTCGHGDAGVAVGDADADGDGDGDDEATGFALAVGPVAQAVSSKMVAAMAAAPPSRVMVRA